MGNQVKGLSRRRRTSGNHANAEAKRFKVLIMGASGVGKTTLFRCLLDQQLPSEYEASTAVEIGAKLLRLEGEDPVLIELWDVPHRFYAGKGIFDTYLRGVDGVLLVYDVTMPTSWQAIVDYHTLITENAVSSAHSDAPVIFSVVGNKIDSEQQSPMETELTQTTHQWIAACTGSPPLRIHHHLVSATKHLHTLELLRSCAANIQKSQQGTHSSSPARCRLSQN